MRVYTIPTIERYEPSYWTLKWMSKDPNATQENVEFNKFFSARLYVTDAYVYLYYIYLCICQSEPDKYMADLMFIWYIQNVYGDLPWNY